MSILVQTKKNAEKEAERKGQLNNWKFMKALELKNDRNWKGTASWMIDTNHVWGEKELLI